MRTAWAERMFADEPMIYAVLIAESLFRDPDFDESWDCGRRRTLKELADADRLATSVNGRRRGPRRFPRQRDPFGTGQMPGSLVPFLGPFARFFAEAFAALERGENIVTPEWHARATEVCLIVMFTRPGREMMKILFELAARANIPASRDLTRESREQARADAVEQWCGRVRAVESYLPTAANLEQAHERACRYVLAGLSRSAKRSLTKMNYNQSPQTIARYKREFGNVTPDAADTIAETKMCRKTRASDRRSEKHVAQSLGRARATVQRARAKAMAAGALKINKDEDGVWRYSAKDVAALREFLPKKPT